MTDEHTESATGAPLTSEQRLRALTGDRLHATQSAHPALHVAPGVTFAGSPDRVEARLVAEAGYDFEVVDPPIAEPTDLGPALTEEVLSGVRKQARAGTLDGPGLRDALRLALRAALDGAAAPDAPPCARPS
jgi:hypothetical protein